MRITKVAMIALIVTLLSTVLITSSCNGATVGSSTTGNIVGTINDLRGNAEANVSVILSNSTGSIRTTTNASGGFEFNNVTAGNYVITVSISGRTALTKDVTVTAGQTNNVGTLTVNEGIRTLFLIIIPIVLIIVIIVIVILVIHHIRKKKKKKKENEELYRQQQEEEQQKGLR